MIQGFMAGAYVALGALFANLMEGKFTHYDGDDFEVAPGKIRQALLPPLPLTYMRN